MMKTESLVRVFTGTLVLLSLVLTLLFNPWWLTLAAFVGVNLVQSALSEFCLVEVLLLKLRWKSEHPSAPAAKPSA